MVAPLPSVLSTPWVTKACRLLHENKTWKVLGVEVLGINMPKTVIVRTPNEALDVGVNEFGNTVGFFGGLWGGAPLIDKVLTRMKIPINPNPAVLSRGRVMKSFALVPPLFALMAAMPFFRNAFTAWRSGTLEYQKLITAKGTKPRQQHQTEDVKEAIKGFTAKGLAVVAAGAALGAFGFLWARSDGLLRLFKPGTSKLLPAFKALEKPLKALCLTGKKATEYKDLRALFYWGMPAYLGWMAASRDMYEVKEQFLKMLNFMGVYFLTEKGVNWFFNQKSRGFAARHKQLYPQGQFSYGAWQAVKAKTPAIHHILRFENLRKVTGFGMTVLLMATLPALLNIYLTKRRMAQSEAGPISVAGLPLPGYETFQPAWAQRLENRPVSGYAGK